VEWLLIIIALGACGLGLFYVGAIWKERKELIGEGKQSNRLSPPPPPPPPKSEPRKTEDDKEPDSPAAGGLVLNGFTDGAAALINVPGELFDRQPWGVSFGRDPSLVDLVLKDDRGLLSRRHFRISRRGSGQQYEIEDLGSAAGVKVKGDALKPFDRKPLPVPCNIEIGAATALQVRVA
jgi:pSer/pThr/pTyr-binding forkhead associated (FHA) protein